MKQPQELLKLIDQGTAWATGAEFFESLVINLSEALDTCCSFVTEFSGGNRIVKPLAFWRDGHLIDAPEYDIAGTPCEVVLAGEIAAFPQDVCSLFPMDRAVLEDLGAESYLAIPIKNVEGRVLGHLATIDWRPRDWSQFDFGILRIFGARTAGELGRRSIERALEAANTRLAREVESRKTSEEMLRRSEQAYRDLYEDAPVAYWSVGTDRIVRRVNKRVSEFLGCPREEIVGQSLAAFTAPGESGEPRARAVFERFLRGEPTTDQEVEFRTRDGRPAWASVSVTPVFNAAGEVEVSRSVVVDITARKQAELDLEHRVALENLIATASSRFARASGAEVDREINRCMMEMAQFYVIDRMCVYTFTEDAQAAVHTHAWIAPGIVAPAEHVTCAEFPAVFRDLQAGLLVGANTLDRLPPGYEPLRKRLEHAGVRSVAILPLDYGNRVLGMLLLEAARSEQEWAAEDLRLLRLLGEIIASTLERRNAERAVEEARQIAEAASQAKTEFLANMSHELRTPLNGILGYAQILTRDTSLDMRYYEAVHGVQHCGEHLLDLINEVLDHARIESGRLELLTEPVELAPLIASAADVARIRASEAGLEFRCESAPGLPRSVLADQRRLKQVLLNLLGNAVKFTEAGEVGLKVSGERGASDRWRLRFEVADTGVGIPTGELPRIFEPFHRVANPQRNVEGTGLGLAITEKLVRAMGGQLQVTSTVGSGSVFTAELTLASAGRPPVEASLPPISGYHGRRRKILVADDKADNRTVLRRVLEPLGFEIVEAATGNQALAAAERERPDLALLDLVMPELDGFEVARRLRAIDELAATPIVAVSASAFEDTRRESLEAGCDDFLPKPVQLDNALGMIRRLLRLRWTYGSTEPGFRGEIQGAPDRVGGGSETA